MAFSYSFHISKGSHAVATTGKLSQVSKHNTRAYESKQYDRSLIETVRGSDNITADVKKIYHEQFDAALEKYNYGKREDRQIHDYLAHVSNSRNDVAVEIIIQIGDKDFWADKSMDERKRTSYIFKDQLKRLEQLLPDFKIASAIIHYDENSPHMHVVGVPVADKEKYNLKNGLQKQCVKTKIFTTSTLSMLQDKMRERAERGIEMNRDIFGVLELKEKEKGRNKDIPKKSLDEYYRLKDETKDLDVSNADAFETLKDLSEQCNNLEQEKDVLSNEKAELQKDILALNKELDRADSKIKQLEQKLEQIDEKTEKVYTAATSENNLIHRFLQIPEIAQKFIDFGRSEQEKAEKEKADTHKDNARALEQLKSLIAHIRAGIEERQAQKERELAERKRQQEELRKAEEQRALEQQETANSLKRILQDVPRESDYSARIKYINYAYNIYKDKSFETAEIRELARKVLSKMGVYSNQYTEPQEIERNVERVLKECENGLKHESLTLSPQEYLTAAQSLYGQQSQDAPMLNGHKHDYDAR